MKFLILLILSPAFVFSQVQLGEDIDGETADDESGWHLSLSSDGNIIAIGAQRNDGSFDDAGHVRVYTFESGVWTQLGDDIDGEETGDRSGRDVSLSSDGGTLAIGASWNDGSFDEAGHVRIYKFESDVWIQLGSDIDGEALMDHSGGTVSLSSDGTIVAIGATLNDGAAINAGHVRVYKFEADEWIQLGDDIDGEGATDLFGGSISLSSDGTIVAIGGIGNDGFASNAGHVQVYQYDADVWTQLGEDITGDEADAQCGYSASLSSEGDIVAIGARGANGESGPVSGHVRVYKYESGSWTQLGGDIDGENAGDQSGHSVSLSSEGNIVSMGTHINSDAGSYSGHARVFVFDSGTWTQLGNDIDGEAWFDNSALGISLSEDGDRLAIGAPYNDGSGDNAGHVRVYDFTLLLSTDIFQKDYFSFYPNPVKNVLTISVNEGADLIQINIYDAMGKSVKSTRKSEINMRDLEPGVYFMEIETNHGKSTKKVIVA